MLKAIHNRKLLRYSTWKWPALSQTCRVFLR